jgi:hypothetical protein
MGSTTRNTQKRIALAVFLAWAILGAAGCKGGADIPKTHPATGRVTYADGKPFSGGAIQFVPLNDQSLTISGKIDTDGNFSLRTIKDGTTASGAPEGEYRVTIVPSSPSHHEAVRPHTLPKTERIETKTNKFEFAIPRPDEPDEPEGEE